MISCESRSVSTLGGVAEPRPLPTTDGDSSCRSDVGRITPGGAL